MDTYETPRLNKLDGKFAEAERMVKLGAPGRHIYKRLSILRARLAKDLGVPAYQIMGNHLLLTLSEVRPVDEAALLRVQGFGRLRFLAYGAELLAVLNGSGGSDASPPRC